ncbi:MAG TPA: NDP-sugar synthase, partial [Methanocorpusculum sp.]|nr:NDP-sugar synthase [Methanocorpusculum sp.]
HINSTAITSIALISIEDPQEYGIAEIDASLQIKRFREKPAPGEIFSNLASTGIYVCNPKIFEFIPKNTKFDFAKDLFPLLMDKGHIIRGWLARGNWTDVGNPIMLREAEKWMLQRNSTTRMSGSINITDAHISGPVSFENNVSLGSGTRVVGPVHIGSDTSIGNDVIIGPYTCIGNGVNIKNNSKIFSSSIYNGVVIGSNTTISGSIIDNNAVISDNCSIEHNTVVGFKSVIHNNVTIHSGTRVWHDVDIPEGTIIKEHVINKKYDINNK